MNGLLLIDKPVGWTSFDVVAKVRGMVRQETGVKRPKVGHAGTLDPLATGLLVILVGSYCKKASDYSKLDKTYEVDVTLGKSSTTDDGEGEISPVSDKQPLEDDLQQVLDSFTGKIQQTPPAFSAIKIDGKRAYKLAREGKTPEMKAREVTVYSISGVHYSYPELHFITEVSSGTYIRSLARDIGEKLGTGAYMSGLRRATIGKFRLEDAHQIDAITSQDLSRLLVE